MRAGWRKAATNSALECRCAGLARITRKINSGRKSSADRARTLPSPRPSCVAFRMSLITLHAFRMHNSLSLGARYSSMLRSSCMAVGNRANSTGGMPRCCSSIQDRPLRCLLRKASASRSAGSAAKSLGYKRHRRNFSSPSSASRVPSSSASAAKTTAFESIHAAARSWKRWISSAASEVGRPAANSVTNWCMRCTTGFADGCRSFSQKRP
mmetsp:Transcript_30217/g.80369  ORF Transcript_30217/g.80369 Transcript_30217/m.80369 type:complete len:211 (-) Transcript_30217:78-710(-)